MVYAFDKIKITTRVISHFDTLMVIYSYCFRSSNIKLSLLTSTNRPKFLTKAPN